jgi:hypothetical protein
MNPCKVKEALIAADKEIVLVDAGYRRPQRHRVGCHAWNNTV